MAIPADAPRELRTALRLRGGRPIAFVDGRNVQRSSWPNASDDTVVRGSCEWARQHSLLAVIVFDGRTAAAGREDCLVISARDETADEWLIRSASRLERLGVPYWLITSDRELRRLAGQHAERVIGGGRFLRQIAPR